MELGDVVDIKRYPLSTLGFQADCRHTLDSDGALVMPGFLAPAAVWEILREGTDKQHLAFYSTQKHNAYLLPPDPAFSDAHPRNRLVTSTKGCITDDLIAQESPLRVLYDSPVFQDFLCVVLGESALYRYADPLSSINLNYAKPGQELGWHFDNSSFAITLMIAEAEAGGSFEYVNAVRDADRGEMQFDNVERILDGEIEPDVLTIGAGSLALFRGRNALHRVTPVEGSKTRVLVVLAYNSEPGISLSESARMTFFGRLN